MSNHNVDLPNNEFKKHSRSETQKDNTTTTSSLAKRKSIDSRVYKVNVAKSKNADDHREFEKILTEHYKRHNLPCENKSESQSDDIARIIENVIDQVELCEKVEVENLSNEES